MKQMELKRIASVAGKLLFLVLLSIAGWSLVVHLLNQDVDERSPFAKPTPTVFVGFLESRANVAPHFPTAHKAGAIMPPSAKPAVADAISTKIVSGVKAAALAPTEIPIAVQPRATVPMILGQGSLVDGDTIHKGTGLVTLYSLADGSHLVRFDDLTASSGPDLHILLSPNAAPTDPAGLGDYLDVGLLTDNIGDFSFEIAAGTDITQYKSAVIYCKSLNVIFATAALE